MDNDDLKKTMYIRGDELAKSVIRYRDIMEKLEADLPLQCLCLPKSIEKILLDMGCLRIYDVVGLDLTKIKGIGDRRRAILSACLNQFLSM